MCLDKPITRLSKLYFTGIYLVVVVASILLSQRDTFTGNSLEIKGVYMLYYNR
jgi:hypothetical protein